MNGVVQVGVHPTVFPGELAKGLLRSLESRKIDPKFHYMTEEQARKWLAVHEAHSPARRDAGCQTAYTHAFAATAARFTFRNAHVVGLGCGGGQKDAALLQQMTKQGREVSYTPCDASLPLVLVSREEARRVDADLVCHPLVCDIGAAEDLSAVLNAQSPDADWRVICLFGMIPNFEPEAIFPKLAAMLRPKDVLLISANLAPGTDYAAGVQKVLPGYDNTLTREWLAALPRDLGIPADAGGIQFGVEDSESGVKRIVADFVFDSPCAITVSGGRFRFVRGDKLRLFFSYRHTAALVPSILGGHGLKVLAHWEAASGEEGVFLCQRGAD